MEKLQKRSGNSEDAHGNLDDDDSDWVDVANPGLCLLALLRCFRSFQCCDRADGCDTKQHNESADNSQLQTTQPDTQTNALQIELVDNGTANTSVPLNVFMLSLLLNVVLCVIIFLTVLHDAMPSDAPRCDCPTCNYDSFICDFKIDFKPDDVWPDLALMSRIEGFSSDVLRGLLSPVPTPESPAFELSSASVFGQQEVEDPDWSWFIRTVHSTLDCKIRRFGRSARSSKKASNPCEEQSLSLAIRGHNFFSYT